MKPSKSKKQSKFMSILKTPIKILNKASDLYVKSMTTGCGPSISSGHSMVVFTGPGEFPLCKSYSVGNISSTSRETDDYGELLRAASVRNHGHVNEVDMYMHKIKRESTPVSCNGLNSKKKLPKSCSVGVGFMGRIDEDNPCEFEENSDGSKADLYSRSKSYAIGKQ